MNTMLERLKQYQSFALPVALLVIGSLILLAQLMGFDWLGLTWSFFIILPGLAMLHVAIQTKSAQYARLIFPAIVVLLTGVILLYQTLTNHWRSWTFLWALYVVFFGVGLQAYGRRTENKNDVVMGRNLILGGLATFVFLWMLFELVIFSAVFSTIIGYVLPAVFIGASLMMFGNHYRVYQLEMRQKVAQLPKNETKTDDSAYISKEIVISSAGEYDFTQFSRPMAKSSEDVLADITDIKPIRIDESSSDKIDPELQRKINAALNDDADGNQ
ncbi:MAG: hypothetical protein MUE54_00410 [Anaerolineae bacterium]|jgi:hypothetical protein|nr:hypothetical protein [Anaerolineae bacterium]